MVIHLKAWNAHGSLLTKKVSELACILWKDGNKLFLYICTLEVITTNILLVIDGLNSGQGKTLFQHFCLLIKNNEESCFCLTVTSMHQNLWGLAVQ